MTADPTPRAPGWYDDPVLSGAQRYWDGTKWRRTRRSRRTVWQAVVVGLVSLIIPTIFLIHDKPWRDSKVPHRKTAPAIYQRPGSHPSPTPSARITDPTAGSS